MGQPAYQSRRLQFASGAEVILQDDAVVATVLHAAPTDFAAHGFDLPEWIPGLNSGATLEDLKKAIDAPRYRTGMAFDMDGAYAVPNFKNNRGWNDPGNLLSITLTVEAPGRSCRPEDDNCPVCSDVLVRNSDSDGDQNGATGSATEGSAAGMDVERTIAALSSAVSAGLIKESLHWVPLADLRPLYASGLMERAESQLTCTQCRRIICLTLFRASAPTFVYAVMDEARRRPLEKIPPVEQWGDASRLAKDRKAMHYVDHHPSAWFLVEQQGELFLQARYWLNSMVDSDVLLRLEPDELEAYRSGGKDFLSDLAQRIDKSRPHTEESPYFHRDLYRGPDSAALAKSFAAAIVNHTWIAEQRRRP
ncbi:hypothetical protein [Arthrobacter sp. ISL-95]|uniref:hypothetical protein n=1 Tax=Arthrobacter sp. ISL-95 TaxID=2819116 RepID=UPI001BE6106A|nr:hypothetical protein [Arthrobacter sp. ISL-95]MBT2584474.1 hypothetical protein [Arthrobacter sp. ISL-95]